MHPRCLVVKNRCWLSVVGGWWCDRFNLYSDNNFLLPTNLITADKNLQTSQDKLSSWWSSGINWCKGPVRKYFIELALLKIFTITNKLSLFLSNYNSFLTLLLNAAMHEIACSVRPETWDIWWWRRLLTSVIHQNWKYNLQPPVANFVYEANWELRMF